METLGALTVALGVVLATALFHEHKWAPATIIVFGIPVPFPLLARGNVRRTPWPMLLVGILVNIAMFSERMVVVIPPTSRNVLTWGNYTPDWVGISITYFHCFHQMVKRL